MSTPKTFSFHELIQGRESSVRVTDDNMLYAVDLAMVVTGATRDDAGKALRRLSDEVFPSDKMSVRTLPGKGNAHTKLVSFEDALLLVMVLPGKVAKETRSKFAAILRRYLAGDKSLISEVEANAQSTSPIAELARGAGASAEDGDAQRIVRKRKFEELEITRLTLENEQLVERIKADRLRTLDSAAASYRDICKDSDIDDRARIMLKDTYLNICIMANIDKQLITNGAEAASVVVSTTGSPISVSMVADAMGIKLSSGQLISAGAEISKHYKELHGKGPSKHGQMCGGRPTMINSYFECDRAMIEEVLRNRA